MKDNDWRLLLTPQTCLSATPFRYGFDSGAWHAFANDKPFDVDAYERGLDRVGAGADWIVAPDIVQGGRASLDLSISWMPRLLEVGPTVLIVLQDGMTTRDMIAVFRSYGTRIGFFLGGSTEWKVGTMRRWGRLARRLGVYYHVGRVNTAKRLAMASWAGADSVDGTSGSKFADTIQMLAYAAQQQDLFLAGR